MAYSLATLRSSPLLAGMSDGDLESLVAEAEHVEVAAGDFLFHEGEEGTCAYIITDGEVEIIKRSGSSDVAIAVRGAGDVIGEIALLMDDRRSAGVRATTPVSLVKIQRAHLEGLIDASVTAAKAVYSMLLERFQNTQSKLRHSERMAQLGTLSAGLAHELNNPTAAVTSAASRLDGALRARDAAWSELRPGDLSPDEAKVIEAISSRDRSAFAPLSGLARADLEDDIEQLLGRAGAQRVGALAGDLAAAHVELAEVSELAAALPRDVVLPALRLIAADAELKRLFGNIQTGAGRVTELVEAMKRYSYLDQAPVQEVDVASQLDDTITVLATTLEGIEIVTDFQPDLPLLEAQGAELNQVWSNLLDNAAYAVRETGRPDGVITIRLRHDDGTIRVEVEDNGAGVPADIRDRIFDPFFTTKPPGEGAGLGLDVSHSVACDRHGGRLWLDADERVTRFIVELPRAR